MQQPFTNNSFEHHLDNQLAGYEDLLERWQNVIHGLKLQYLFMCFHVGISKAYNLAA